MSKPLALTEQLRRAILTCGRSRYALSRITGIDQATLSRFINGRGGLSMIALDVLAAELGLEIVVRKQGDPRQ